MSQPAEIRSQPVVGFQVVSVHSIPDLSLMLHLAVDYGSSYGIFVTCTTYHGHVSSDRLEKLRALSQAAFGQRYRLELMLAVAESEDGIVCLTDLAHTLNVTISNLQQPLKALVATGLLSPLPAGDSRRKFYMRNPSAAWAWAAELGDASRDLDRGRQAASTDQP